jgi:hypothetical protein
MCGAELDANARYCRVCGALVEIELLTIPTYPTPLHPSGFSALRELWRRYSPIVLYTVLVIFASYILWQHAIHTEVAVYFTDDAFYRSILSELRVHPTDYYSITDSIYRRLYSSVGAIGGFVSYFPLMFYIWLLVPNVGDIKWLYMAFALAGTVASYFAVYSVTKQSLVAVLSAAWMAYFLETPYYLMLEYWGISVFLIGLAFFVMKRHVHAAVVISVATLIKVTCAPFMLFASLYYLAASWKEWWPIVFYFLTGRRRETYRRGHYRKAREALVWIFATCIVGCGYYLNEHAAGARGLAATGAGVMLHYPQGFRLEILAALFGGNYFLNPPLPIIVTIVLALIGMTFLGKDQRPVMYASFAFLPLLIPAGVVQLLGLTLANWPWTIMPERWLGISMTMVNLFWLAGFYKIYEGIYRMIQHSLSPAAHRQSLPESLPVT